ncbi:MAG: ATP-binding protein [Bdellovibrionales bacterium]
MTFSKKIFIAVFFSTFAIGSLLVWTAHRYVSQRSEDEFISRYTAFTRVLADTLGRLDVSTEALMRNAAKVVAARDAEKGLLSTRELKEMRGDLGITHIFVLDRDGRFIRSTNESPHLIPNLYSFCDEYRGVIDGTYDQDATPIIKPQPEPKPYKFLFVPSADRKRIIEVGVRVDSIAKTLMEAIKADANVKTMFLYSPDGTAFGRYTADLVAFDERKAQFPANLNSMIQDPEHFRFFAKVTSSHPKCCQCDKSGTSRNGEYYYVLENAVSKAELRVVQARTSKTFGWMMLGNILLSFILGRVMSRKLVRNIEQAAGRVREIKNRGDSSGRIQLQGKDEVAFLTNEFDHLLDTIEESQAKILEAEKIESKVQLARVVAHNIRSPVIAIEMLLPAMVTVPEKMKNILRNSVKEIKHLSERLSNQSDSMIVATENVVDSGLVYLPTLLDELVKRKQVEYSKNRMVKIKLAVQEGLKATFVKADGTELSSIFSNLVNNAVESYGGKGGDIEIDLHADGDDLLVCVADNGAGIPQEYLADLGQRSITFKGSKSRGLGLVHAFKTVASWGGKIQIKSEIGVGTAIIVRLPKYQRPASENLLPELAGDVGSSTLRS